MPPAVTLVEAAYHLGRPRPDLPSIDHSANHRRVEVDTAAMAELDAIAAVNRGVAEAVRGAAFPVVLSRDCNSALGTLTGLDNSKIGVIWFDAHGDYNTPETSPSGFFDRMTLSVAVGDCHRDVWAQTGGGAFFTPSRILLAGTRDLDPLEKPRLEQSQVQMAGTTDWSTFGLMLEKLASQAAAIYLHIDLDAIDPGEAPGVGFPTPGGLSAAQVERAIGRIGEQFRICAAAFTNYDAARDVGGATSAVASRLLDAIIEARAK